MTTVNGVDCVPVCLDACSDTWEEEFFDNLGQEDQGEEKMKKQYCHWNKLFLESRGRFTRCYASGEFYGQFICCTDSHCKTDHSS